MSIFSNIFGSETQLGIDFGTAFLKVVELAKDGAKPKLKNYALTDLASFSNDSLKLTDNDLANAIRKTINDAGMKSKKANMSIPLFSSFSTIMEMPLLKQSELNEAISFEARQYIPISTSEVSLDWTVLSTNEAERKMKILLVAVPLEVISRYLHIAKLANLDLKNMEIESFSLLRSLIGERSQGVYCVADIGYRSTNIVIVDQGWATISHYYEIGGSELSYVLKQSLNISDERAEELKIKIGLAGAKEDKEISSIMFVLTDKILGEIQRTLNAYYKKEDKKVEKVILSGGTAHLKGLPDYVSSQLGIETVLAEPFSAIEYPAILKPAIDELNPTLPIAVGAAMKDL